MKNNKTIIIVGGGHAGFEAAMAASKMKNNVLLFILDPLAAGRMSCNPSIGGLAKGHLVKEIDSIGGMMAMVSDIACIQHKTLNKSKGRAVWSPRSQVDKKIYSSTVCSLIKKEKNIKIVKEEVVDIHLKKGRVVGVKTSNSQIFHGDAVVITTGTFLDGIIHIGDSSYAAGRFGEKPSTSLTVALKNKGVVSGRLKTGTPPRLDANTIDWSVLEGSYGDKNPIPFSSRTRRPFSPPDLPSFIAYTNKTTHGLLEDSIDKSPLFTGKIKGVGPRYCPSIEDKIVRFSDRDRHQLFLEPEWKNSNQIYVNGFSTSMPKEIQLVALQTIPGLQACKMIRPGYAIEYDYFPTYQLKLNLENKNLPGLFFAGQVNGTSGYEEAAAQGLIAGINASLYVKDLASFHVSRSQGYIGVLIDDLITKTIDEPYRMFTSSAEFRLSLRPDNAPLRLAEPGFTIGLLNKKQHNKYLLFKSGIEKIKKILGSTSLSLNKKEKKEVASTLLRRPSVSINDFFKTIPQLASFKTEELFTAETDIKYDGYVSRETERVNSFAKAENTIIPPGLRYPDIKGLSSESREKLAMVRPETLGQANRVSGVRRSDVFLLGMYLKRTP